MSAVNKPNKNFENETMTHTPYKEIMASSMTSLYDRFMTPKDGKSIPKKQKPILESGIKTTGFNKWFK